jgi:hypothetical protein
MANAVELARRLAEIASKTRDPDTAQELMALVEQLFGEAGLSDRLPEPPVKH